MGNVKKNNLSTVFIPRPTRSKQCHKCFFFLAILELSCLWSVFTLVASINPDFLEQKKEFNYHRICLEHQYIRRNVI